MRNPIRYNFGGNIPGYTRNDKPASIALSDTSNILEIRPYTYDLESVSNTTYFLYTTPNNYAVNTELYPSGLYNRVYMHSTAIGSSLSEDPTKNFTLAQPNSFFDYNLLLNGDLTYNLRISRY
jgi:hypothetical protein